MLSRRTNELMLYGSSFRTATIAVREKIQDILLKSIELNGKNYPFDEALLLTTCNRVELYAVSDSIYKFKDLLDDDFKRKIQGFNADSAYFINGPDVVRHLLRVSIGMDSLLPGEEGIAHQIKAAMVKYQRLKLARPVIGSVFGSVIRASWSMRKLYNIKAEGEEIGNVIATKIKAKMDKGFRVTIIGSGRTAQEVYKSLKEYVDYAYIITRREWLPSQLEGTRRVGYDLLDSALRDSQVIISATNAKMGDYILTGDNVPSNLRLLVDLSVPRSIDPTIKDSGLELWDMDSLGQLLGGYRFSYPDVINRALDEAADRIYYDIYYRRLEGSLKELYKSAYKIALSESLNAQKLMDKGKYSRGKIIDTMAERIVKKMLDPLSEVPKDPASTYPKLEMIKGLCGDKLNDKARD